MRISIITATWNSGATLRYTMRSVLSQSYSDIEHIIVDGGSTDSTMEIIHELEPEYRGKLRYISGKDQGIYDAMNKGIAMAAGDIVGILNSDDFYTGNNVLSTVASAFEGGDIDAVYGDIHYVQDNDLQKCTRYYSSKLFHRRWMRLGFMPAHPSFYCRKEIYEKYGGFDLSYKIAADFECLLRLIFVHKIRLRYIPMDFVTMRTGGASTNGFSSHKQILRDHQRAFKDNGIYSNVLLESLRYIYKIYEIIETKVSRK
ncbi:glycosyltransferase family 2 protein [Bacteroides sp. AN502(2024)]|uniref:glycosyltransferase family 2 protein n=1 Tax=Bacteroides sp. AN502(2024) TaxID=3160599 RepID=UPI003511A5B5